jgi:hypothetical protein
MKEDGIEHMLSPVHTQLGSTSPWSSWSSLFALASAWPWLSSPLTWFCFSLLSLGSLLHHGHQKPVLLWPVMCLQFIQNTCSWDLCLSGDITCSKETIKRTGTPIPFSSLCKSLGLFVFTSNRLNRCAMSLLLLTSDDLLFLHYLDKSSLGTWMVDSSAF